MSKEKTMLRHAAEGLAITFFGDSFYKLLGIITSFVVLAVLTPYEYGLWRLLQSVLSFMSIIALSGITGVVVADIARELGRGEKRRAYAVIWRCALVITIGSAVAGLVLVAAAPFVSAASKIHVTLYLWILAGSIVFGGITQVLQILFQARLEPLRALILKNASNLSYLVAIILLVPFLHLSLLGLVIAYVIATAVPVLLFIPYILRELRLVMRERERGAYSLRDVLVKRGGWAIAGDYASIIESSLWPWIVGFYLSIEQVGYASLAIVIVSQVYSLIPLQYLLRSILPRFSDDAMRMNEWMIRSVRYSIWIHAVAAVTVLSAALLVLPRLFPSYAHAVPLACALLISVPFRAVGAVLTEWFYATLKQKELFLSTGVPRLVALVFLPFLVSHFGLAGFALWYILSSFSIIFMRFTFLGQNLRIPLNPRSLFIPDARDIVLIRTAIARIRSKAGIKEAA